MTKTEIEAIRIAAANGDAAAQYYLGICHARGEGVEQSDAKRDEWFSRAAKQGHISASLYLKGLSGSKFPNRKLIRIYENDADKQVYMAMLLLGIRYDLGDDVEANRELADKWYAMAAAQCLSEESWQMYQLGLSLDNGDEQNLEEAAKCYKNADAKGHPLAHRKLAICADKMYWLGHRYETVEKDLEMAVLWYDAAAELGQCDAMYRLGCCYLHGKGVTKDIGIAVEWFKKAAAEAECGNINARSALFALQNPDLMKPCVQHYLDVRTERRDYERRYSVGIDYIVNRDGTVALLRCDRYPESIDRQTLDEENWKGLGHFRREGGRFGSFPE